jgi:hypothetical protein
MDDTGPQRVFLSLGNSLELRNLSENASTTVLLSLNKPLPKIEPPAHPKFEPAALPKNQPPTPLKTPSTAVALKFYVFGTSQERRAARIPGSLMV